MKRLSALLLIAVAALTGCAKFHDGRGAWPPLWKVPLLPFYAMHNAHEAKEQMREYQRTNSIPTNQPTKDP